jgi:hypothetical protein
MIITSDGRLASCLLLTAALLTSASPASAQADTPAVHKSVSAVDAIAGDWEWLGTVRSRPRHIKLYVTQNGENVRARMTIVLNAPQGEGGNWELDGTIRDGKINLRERYAEGIRMTGERNGDVLRLRVIDGKDQEASAFVAQFRRVQRE